MRSQNIISLFIFIHKCDLHSPHPIGCSTPVGGCFIPRGHSPVSCFNTDPEILKNYFNVHS